MTEVLELLDIVGTDLLIFFTQDWQQIAPLPDESLIKSQCKH